MSAQHTPVDPTSDKFRMARHRKESAMVWQQTRKLFRFYTTKSRVGHYTATVRTRNTGELVHIQDKLPDLEAVRREHIAGMSKPGAITKAGGAS